MVEGQVRFLPLVQKNDARDMQNGKLSIFVGVFIAAVGKIENTGFLVTVLYAFIGGGAAYLGKLVVQLLISKAKNYFKNKKRMKIAIKHQTGFIWVLDNGHGSDTKGKRSKEIEGVQLLEYNYNRAIVKLIAEKLEMRNKNYVILVVEETDVPLFSSNEFADTRVKRANSLRCGYPNHNVVLLSVHGNAAEDEKANGIEVFTSPGETESDKIATVLCKQLKELGLKMREDYSDLDPDKEEKFTILTKTSCPAILSENGFYTNPEEMKLMLTEEFQDKVAEAHVKAMCEIEDGIKQTAIPDKKAGKKGSK